MPYYVQKSGKTWQLTFREYPASGRNVPKGSLEALNLGFRPEMTLDEAKSRVKQIHNEDWVKRRGRIELRLLTKAKIRGAFLTDEDATSFESVYLKEHKITPPYWSMVQQLIVDVEIHPSEWFERKNVVYAAFLKHKYSPNTAKKLLRYLNLWGYFLCKKHNKAWMKVPGMDGSWKNRLEATRTSHGASKPLSPQQLEEKRLEMPRSAYEWLFISVWFGLRPREVDNLKTPNPDLWYITKESEGSVLSVFQEKLFERGIPKDDCWKHIPTEFPEQAKAIEYILGGKFDKPMGSGGKFMRIFGEGYSHYAGRNNFSGMLRDRGYDLEARKHWLGHLSIKTTEAYDRKTMKRKVFRPIKA